MSRFLESCIAVWRLLVTTVLWVRSIRSASASAVEELSIKTELKEGRCGSALPAAHSFSLAFSLMRVEQKRIVGAVVSVLPCVAGGIHTRLAAQGIHQKPRILADAQISALGCRHCFNQRIVLKGLAVLLDLSEDPHLVQGKDLHAVDVFSKGSLPLLDLVFVSGCQNDFHAFHRRITQTARVQTPSDQIPACRRS